MIRNKHRKRKLDDYNVDTIDNKPHRKKRKLNGSITKTMTDNDFNNSYIISINCHICNEYFDELDEYKYHLKKHYNNNKNKWLKCDLGCKNSIFNDFPNFVCHIASHTKKYPFFKCNITHNNNKCILTARTISDMKLHWDMKHKNQFNQSESESENECSDYENNSTTQTTIINTTKEMTEFENSYVISIHCHLCKKHFNTLNEYKYHLKKHYQNDKNKKWLKCDLGCDDNAFKHFTHFMPHIASHTKKYPFKCTKCIFRTMTKSNMKTHWNRQHNIKKKKKIKIKKRMKTNKIIVETEFENSYYVSINCHLCKKHFNALDEYKLHLKKHYTNNKNKKWLKCDLGCKNNIFQDATHFICHIASHLSSYPFKCNISHHRNKCKFTTATKSNMKKHWNTQHNKNKNNKPKEDEESEYESSSTDSYSESISEESECDEFEENGYFVSVNCHICKKNFNDFVKYRKHLQKHYNNDKNRKWFECDFGCKQKNDSLTTRKFRDSHLFVAHIASHTNDYPFHCNAMVNGKKCKRASGKKSNLKSHWQACHKRNSESESSSESSSSEYDSSSSSESK